VLMYDFMERLACKRFSHRFAFLQPYILDTAYANSHYQSFMTDDRSRYSWFPQGFVWITRFVLFLLMVRF